jgi:hypothetical protein
MDDEAVVRVGAGYAMGDAGVLGGMGLGCASGAGGGDGTGWGGGASPEPMMTAEDMIKWYASQTPQDRPKTPSKHG